MDASTLKAYQSTPHNQTGGNLQIENLLAHYFQPNHRILEIGCGNGYFSEFLAKQQCQVLATDAIANPYAIQRAQDHHFSFKQMTFPSPKNSSLKSFAGAQGLDGVLCLATLMHIPDPNLLSFFQNIRDLLKEGGALIISFCHGGRDLDDQGYDARGILYQERNWQEYVLLLERLGFQIIERQLGKKDQQGRKGILWDTLVALNYKSATSQGLSSALSIISNDKKTTTYKLALLRAILDIALDQPHQARWTNTDRVHIPLHCIIDQWIRYFWTLQKEGVPQIGAGRSLAFKTELSLAIQKFSDPEKALLARVEINHLIKKIKEAIIDGPVKCTSSGAIPYSIKGLEPNATLFSIDKQDKASPQIEVPVELWHDLSLMGHYIRHSILMEWASVSASFATQKPEEKPRKMGEFLGVLFFGSLSGRYTTEAQKLYLKLNPLKCVWSQKKLTSDNLHIDHMIPFSQWPNNAWWNLLPTHKSVNLKKSDGLVLAKTLEDSANRIQGIWDYTYRTHEEEFISEIKRDFLGSGPLPSHWPELLLAGIRDRIEIMAEQRGLQRWGW